MCGENRHLALRSRERSGSSPRVRGKRGIVHVARTVPGLIPACAGKTVLDQSSNGGLWAHPRVCGENARGRSDSVSPRGSSPRVRGKLNPVHVARAVGRLIPACAGKTKNSRKPRAGLPAHPRVCGENITVNSEEAGAQGSSPRVRGKRASRYVALFGMGLIPACAGKTGSARGWRRVETAHPRVCGENLIGLGADLASMGSSPRVRGKPVYSWPTIEDHGLIPACAGKTS